MILHATTYLYISDQAFSTGSEDNAGSENLKTGKQASVPIPHGSTVSSISREEDIPSRKSATGLMSRMLLRLFHLNKGQTGDLMEGGYYESPCVQIHDQWKDPT
jgi:hypothetical protein